MPAMDSKGLLLVMATLAVAACATASAPAEHVQLTDADQDLIATLVEREFQNGRSDPYNPAPLVLLSDATMANCDDLDSPDVGIDCFATPEWRMPLRSHRGTTLDLGHLFRHVPSRTVSLPPMDKVRLVSIQDSRFRENGRFDYSVLLQAYPSDTRFFALSAPVHLSPRNAAALFRAPDDYSGVAYLVREKSGWVIRDLATSAE